MPHMRFFPSASSFKTILRTLYAASIFPYAGTSAGAFSRRNALSPLSRAVTLRSMPTLPFLGSLFSSSSSSKQDMTDYPLKKSDDEWRAVLNKEQFRILRQKGTEMPHTGEYDKHHPDAGVYKCAGCDAPLYEAKHKFKSGCGWPAYFDAIPGAVTRHEDNSHFMQRIEIVCSNCGGHLGHVFKGEGYDTPTDERHCVNSVSLRFANEGAKDNDSSAEKSKA